MKKTIILAVPYMYGLDQCIEKNLRFLGFDVINLCYDDRDSYYPNLGSRLKNLYHKHITKDGNYKKYLKYSRHLDDIQQKLALLNGKKADYALCIRANIYPKEIEDLVYSLPEIKECALVAKPDAKWGQVPILFVSGNISQEKLENFLFLTNKFFSYILSIKNNLI